MCHCPHMPTALGTSRLTDTTWMILHDSLRPVLQAVSDTQVDVVDEGGAHLLDGRPLIIAANHHNMFDPVLIRHAVPSASRARLRFVAGDNIRQRYPHLTLRHRITLKMFTAVYRPIWSGDGATNAMIEALRVGQTVVVFPEGHYARDDSLLDFRSGAAAAAIATRVPILPCRIEGARSLSGRPGRHHRIRLEWRAAIQPEADKDLVSSRLRQALGPRDPRSGGIG